MLSWHQRTWRRVVVVSLAALFAAGCSSRRPASTGSDGGGSTILQACQVTEECKFGEACVDGFCVLSHDGSRTDRGCVTDADCADDGMVCAPSIGQCIAQADEPSPGDPPTEACEPGTHKPCGSKVGRCEYGVQWCVDGTWDETCHGGVGPTTEVCNGLDDDCDGSVPPDEVDRDGDGTMLCGGDCDDGDPGASPNLLERCDGVDNNCNGEVDENPERLCDDGRFCTGAELCHLGACVPGVPPDCATVADQCNEGFCDPTRDSCVAAAKPDGTACDDGSYCTAGDTCQGGSCSAGLPRDCSAHGGSCRSGSCDEAADSCTGQPVPDGTICDDSQYCTIDDRCQVGSCIGEPRDCSGLNDTCIQGTCDDSLHRCVAEPMPRGTVCDDGLFCTLGDHCDDRQCKGAAARDCSSHTDECNTGACNDERDRCEPRPTADGTLCGDDLFCNGVEVCLAGACQPGTDPCLGVPDVCEVVTCEEATDTCKTRPVTEVDADADGYNACLDCDDNNSAVYPGAPEVCNFIDDNCNDIIDEGFDRDNDGYTTCGGDCDDDDPMIHPGAEECDADNMPDGIDNDCDGYLDEGCRDCDPNDDDGDGFSECDGDCDDTRTDTYPGATETCDGIDNDCDRYTVDNCHVSDRCNWPDPETDRCAEDLLCGCALDEDGLCGGDYMCTSFCNASTTGTLGDTCAQDDQMCLYDVLQTANVHGCAEVAFDLGSKHGGESCSVDSECRSGRCWYDGYGTRCYDYCGSDTYCPAPGTVCGFSPTDRDYDGYYDNADGRCRVSADLGSLGVGESCIEHNNCDHGLCANDPYDPSTYCSELCCTNTDCLAGFGCSLFGDQFDTDVVIPAGMACSSDSECLAPTQCDIASGECVFRFSETVPMCLKNPTGDGTAWTPCTQNGDCVSKFCAEVEGVGVCIDTCCSDTTCPEGLTCELQIVQTTARLISQARVCVNTSVDYVLTRMGD